MDLYKLTAHELHEKLVNKEVSSVELTNAVIARVDAVEDQVNSYVTLQFSYLPVQHSSWQTNIRPTPEYSSNP